MDAALVVLFWGIIALIGGMSGLALVLGMGKAR